MSKLSPVGIYFSEPKTQGWSIFQLTCR